VITGVGAPIRAAWLWSSPRPFRRAAVATATMALASLFGFLWSPDISRMYETWTATRPASSAAQLLRTASDATRRTTSLRAGLEGQLGADPFSGTVVLK